MFELIVRDVAANLLAGYHVAHDNSFALYYSKGSATCTQQNNTQKSIFIFIVKLPLPLFTTVRTRWLSMPRTTSIQQPTMETAAEFKLR